MIIQFSISVAGSTILYFTSGSTSTVQVGMGVQDVTVRSHRIYTGRHHGDGNDSNYRNDHLRIAAVVTDYHSTKRWNKIRLFFSSELYAYDHRFHFVFPFEASSWRR